MSAIGSERQSELPDLKAQMAEVVEAVRGYHAGADLDRLWHAFHMGEQAHEGQFRESGEPYFSHPIAVAQILTTLRLDADTIAAGLLHDSVEDTTISLERLRKEFGDDVATLVDGVTKITQIRHETREAQQAENYRKMLLTMSKDVRVILIKLADRLHNMRTLDSLSDERRTRIANETLTVYAPLAHRFGIARFKWELEDLAFRALHPAEYQEIQRAIELRRDERERIIAEMKQPLEELLVNANIDGRSPGAPSISSRSIRRCRAAGRRSTRSTTCTPCASWSTPRPSATHTLGIVHSNFTPLHDRVKDYVANPKQQHVPVVAHHGVRPFGPTWWRCRSVRARCIDAPRWVSRRTGATRWARTRGRPPSTTRSTSSCGWFREVLDWQRDVSGSAGVHGRPEDRHLPGRDLRVQPRRATSSSCRKRFATPLDFAFPRA